MSSILDQLKTFLREIECPVCKNYLHTNIPVCSQGHSICYSCKQKCSNCPTCKGNFSEGRNYVLEKLISSINIPCKYKSDGCKLQGNLAVISKHIKECEYRDHPCPLSKSHNCSWLGKCQKFKSHLEEAHKNLNLNYTFDIETGIFYMFHENNTFKIWRKNVTDTGLIKWVAEFLGEKDKAKNFLFKIEFSDRNNMGMELSMTAECVPMGSDDGDQIFQNVGISFPAKMLEYFKFDGIYTHAIYIKNRKVT